jgi:RNA polymerase sigma factor (sigma-70 family)
MSSPGRPENAPTVEQARWFAAEVQPHGSSVKAYLRGAFPSIKDVDDLVQESYLRMWKAHHVHPIACARAFLFRVARNLAVNLLHHQNASPITAVQDLSDLPVVDHRPDALSAACSREELLLLARAIESLPPRCREIVILRRIKKLSQREIAARLGISEATVEVQVVRGVRRCGDYLRKQGVRFDYENPR